MTMTVFFSLIQRDVRLAWRNRLDVSIGLVFFLVVAALFPLAIKPSPELLEQIGVAVIMVCGLLANLLTLNRLFEEDWSDGSLLQLLLLPIPNALMVLAKMIAYCLTIGIPLSLVSLLLHTQYQLEPGLMWPIFAAIVLMMGILSALGALSSALTLGLRQSGLLMSLLHLPLCAPVLIFSSRAVYSSAENGFAEWWLLGALLLGTWFFIPVAAAAALRLAVE